MDEVRLTALVSGQVQGVGFRWWTQGRADELGLLGSAVNRPDGRVEIIAEGPREACERMLEALHGSTPGEVREVSERWSAATREFTRFRAG